MKIINYATIIEDSHHEDAKYRLLRRRCNKRQINEILPWVKEFNKIMFLKIGSLDMQGLMQLLVLYEK